MAKLTDVIALGNALMDLLVEVDSQKFLEFNLKKGEMHLVPKEQAQQILEKIQRQQLTIEYVPGGSAANTLRCLGLLGANVILCGKVGKDKHGEMYVEQLQQHQVKTRFNHHAKATGHCVTFITPDAERSFSVHLGAAVELYPEDVLEEDIAVSKILHLEGYQLEGTTKETVFHAMELAKKHGTKISFDLADPGVIRRNKGLIKDIIDKKNIDILFINEKEADELTDGFAVECAVVELGKLIPTVIVKIGERGSLVSHERKFLKIPPFPAKAIDTTGAGDVYAAGFLYGYCQGWDMMKAGKLGSLLAAKVVEKRGVKLDKKEILSQKESLEIG